MITNIIVSIFWVLAFALAASSSTTVVEAGKAATKAISSQDEIAQMQIDAKKDFKVGETARFGEFDVKVNSVDKNYVPASSYSKAEAGSKYVVVNISVSNPTADTLSVSSYDFKINADGVAKSSSYLSIDDDFQGGTLDKGASTSGNLVFMVKDSAKDLKLQYETQVFTPKEYKVAELTYTLGL